MNTDDNINKVIQSDLNLDSDNTSDSDEKYDNLYSDPEEAFKFVNLLSQAYNDGKKDINSKTVQDLLDSTNLNTINEDILNDNSSFNEGHYNTNEVMNYNNNNSYNYKKYTHSTDRSNNILNQYKPGPSNNIINKNDSIETLKRKIQELQSSNDKLKKENKKLTNEKNFKDGEINVIRKRIKTIEQENDDLKKKFINKSKTIEEEKQQERNNYKNEIDRLQTELQFKKQEIEELGISRNHSISKIKETKRNISFPSFNDFPKQPSNNYIPNKASIYTNKSNYLMETESSYQKDVFEIPNNFDDTNIEIKDSPKKNILSKVMTMDISVQTENYDYSNQSSRKVPSKYQIPLPNSRFLFIQRLYNINIYSKLIKYISTENKKQFINTNQNVANPIINKLLSSINDIIANSNIPISNLISPLEEYIGLSLDNNNLKMALTGLKLLLNIILNDTNSKNDILSYPIKDKVIENIHKHLTTMLNIVNQFNIRKSKEYQNLSIKFQKKISNYLFTVLQLMAEECKNSKILSLYRTYLNKNLILDFFNLHQRMDISLYIIQWLQYLIMDYEIEKLFQNITVLESIALYLRHLNKNENKNNLKIQLNIIRLYSLLIAQESQSLRLMANSHIVISNIIFVMQTKLDYIIEEKNTEESKNIMAIIKEGIKFIHSVFIKASNVFKILDSNESVNYIFIRLLSRLVVSKYYEDSWSLYIDDIYDIINDLLESILISTPHENILKKLIPEEYEAIEDKSVKNNDNSNN